MQMRYLLRTLQNQIPIDPHWPTSAVTSMRPAWFTYLETMGAVLLSVFFQPGFSKGTTLDTETAVAAEDMFAH